MDEMLAGEAQDLTIKTLTCPACDAEDAKVIEFPAGRVTRCDACGLLDLQRDEGASAQA